VDGMDQLSFGVGRAPTVTTDSALTRVAQAEGLEVWAHAQYAWGTGRPWRDGRVWVEVHTPMTLPSCVNEHPPFALSLDHACAAVSIPRPELPYVAAPDTGWRFNNRGYVTRDVGHYVVTDESAAPAALAALGDVIDALRADSERTRAMLASLAPVEWALAFYRTIPMFRFAEQLAEALVAAGADVTSATQWHFRECSVRATVSEGIDLAVYAESDRVVGLVVGGVPLVDRLLPSERTCATATECTTAVGAVVRIAQDAAGELLA